MIERGVRSKGIGQKERRRLLETVLAHAIPDSKNWKRELTSTPGFPENESYWMEVHSPNRPTEQSLVVMLRPDGNIQVEYHIASEPGSPFESFFILPPGSEPDAIEQISRFVAELLTEKVVLTWRKGFFRGGRYFIPIDLLTKYERSKLRWITSWLGTFDWRAKKGDKLK